MTITYKPIRPRSLVQDDVDLGRAISVWLVLIVLVATIAIVWSSDIALGFADELASDKAVVFSGIESGWSLRGALEPSDLTAQLNTIAQSGAAIDVGFTGISTKTVLIIFHIFGLTLGFGAAIFLDLYLLRYLISTKIEAHTHSIAQLGSWIVSSGLAIMWITGIGFLAMYWIDTPEKLSNPKIWAKVSIVAVLTINGIAIHSSSLLKLKSKVGQLLLQGESIGVRRMALLTGAVSVVSWSGALLLGVMKELNNVVTSGALLSCYLAAIAVVYLALSLMLNSAESRSQPALS